MKSFWKKLVNVKHGVNTLGDITLQGTTLKDEFNTNTNQGGKILVEARPFFGGGGYQLLQTTSYGPNVEEVFWLPWLNHNIVSTARAAYEHGKCKFFMTTGLTGCRFTITPELVLHVANSVGPNSATRTVAELGHTGPRHLLTRRLSMTASAHPNDFHYAGLHRTLVFGMKLFNGVWTYKIYRTHPLPGSWEIML